ncbi:MULTISPECIES: LysR family transcriptional regulator [Pseudomonadaceae]|nr:MULTISPECIES: LysR family transcriptional regulator [Pseudomonas aeruginosa group]
MELNQVSYFINLAETLNFTAAARLSGVSQPSLTRAIRRLEDELGGPLIYRDGKNSRLTGLGHDVEAEFRRMVVAMKSVRNHSEHWAMGGHRVLDVAVAPTVGPKEFTAFFESALAEMPSIEIKLHSLQSNEDTSEVLSGKYHACIMPRETRPERKLDGKRLANPSPQFPNFQVGEASARHRCGSSSPMRLARWVGRRVSTSFR